MTKRIDFSLVFKLLRENVHFILVEPESPGNVGSVARAMKTCGFNKLILVNPCDLDTPESRMMAHRSMDILKSARIFSSFNMAISDMRLTVGTTMRRRHFKFPFYTPEEIGKKFLETAPEHPVAIIFGRESSGLSNEELLKCHLHSTIPTATQNPALNLSQAVMIYAYTFFQCLNNLPVSYRYDLASQYELEKLYEHLVSSMDRVNFVPRDGIDNFIVRFKRLLGRSMAEKRDVRLLHKLLQIFETKITQLGNETGKDKEKSIY